MNLNNPPETIIEVLDSVFGERDFDIRVLSELELLELAESLTRYADSYTPPERNSTNTRYYGGGVIWAPRVLGGRKEKELGGPQGPQLVKRDQILQTMCMVSDSVVCHDPVADTLYLHGGKQVMPDFYSNVIQGDNDARTHVGNEGNILKNREYITSELNPILKFYDDARFLIQSGILVPAPSFALLYHSRASAQSQLRHGVKDLNLLEIAKQPLDIATSDHTISIFAQPDGMKMHIGPAMNNPQLRLHYGLVHLIRCVNVAVQTKADFAPSDSFGWEVTLCKYDDILRTATGRSKSSFARAAISNRLKIPLVREFSLDEVVSIRRDEEVFDELRRMLRETVEPHALSYMDPNDFLFEYESKKAEAMDDWLRSIQAVESKKSLFSHARDAVIETASTAAVLYLAQVPAEYVAALAPSFGLFGRLVELMAALNDPKQKLVRIIRRHLV